jgi:hypothetical protein
MRARTGLDADAQIADAQDADAQDGAAAVAIDPLALPHITRALQAEVAALRRTQVACAEVWPPGFDPNDIGLYLAVLADLTPDPPHPNALAGCAIGQPRSKPAVFAAAVVRRYLGAHHQLPAAERAALHDVICRIEAANRAFIAR